MKGHLNGKATETYVEIKKFMSVKLQCPFALSNNIKPVLLNTQVIAQLAEEVAAKAKNEGKFLQKFSQFSLNEGGLKNYAQEKARK